MATIKLIFPFIDEIYIISTNLHPQGYSVVSIEVQEKIAGRAGVSVLQLKRGRYFGYQKLGNTYKCYRSEGKGILGTGNQAMPTALFRGNGMLSPQE